MKIAVAFLCIVVFAGSVVAETEKRFWILPKGANAKAVEEKLRDDTLLPGKKHTEALESAMSQSPAHGAKENRIEFYFVDPLTPAQVEALDQWIRNCYAAYRKDRLPDLPELITLSRAELEIAETEARELRTRMEFMLQVGEAVVDREKALAASAELAEDLRRRALDARIEATVLESRIRMVRNQAVERQAHLIDMKARRVALMESELKRRVKLGKLHESNLTQGKWRDEIDDVRRRPLEEDEVQMSLLRKAGDLEVEKIGTEERVKILTEFLQEERRRSLSLLHAKSLDGFWRSKLVPVSARVEKLRTQVEAFEIELAALETGGEIRRAARNPETGAVQYVYLWGAFSGVVILEEGMRLTRLIEIAGDTSKADLRGVRIIRKSKSGKTYAIPVNLEERVDGRVRPELDIVLLPDDIVHVPPKQ